MNYTVITSQCKGPNYTPERCCTPLKQLLCPIKDQVNDLKSNCADVFFSYVNLYGKYPPGLFAALCKEGEQGLNCQDVVVQQSNQQNGALSGGGYSPIVMLFAGVVLVIFYIWWTNVCDVWNGIYIYGLRKRSGFIVIFPLDDDVCM